MGRIEPTGGIDDPGNEVVVEVHPFSTFGVNLNFVGLVWASMGVYLIVGLVVARVSTTLFRMIRGSSPQKGTTRR